MTDEYKIGDTFEEAYPPEAAIWCNANNAVMVQSGTKSVERCTERKEIKNGSFVTVTDTKTVDIPIFKIQNIEPTVPSEKEIAQSRILLLKHNLADSDYKVLKYTEGELSEEEWALAKAERQAWRDEINTLQTKYSIK